MLQTWQNITCDATKQVSTSAPKASPSGHFIGVSCGDTSAKSMTWQRIEEERESHRFIQTERARHHYRVLGKRMKPHWRALFPPQIPDVARRRSSPRSLSRPRTFSRPRTPLPRAPALISRRFLLPVYFFHLPFLFAAAANCSWSTKMSSREKKRGATKRKAPAAPPAPVPHAVPPPPPPVAGVAPPAPHPWPHPPVSGVAPPPTPPHPPVAGAAPPRPLHLPVDPHAPLPYPTPGLGMPLQSPLHPWYVSYSLIFAVDGPETKCKFWGRLAM